MQLSKLFQSLIACFFVFLAACSPVKGYPGPERPDDQVSLINLDYYSGDVEIEDAITEGVSFGFSGIKVLPGKHAFSLRTTVKSPPFDCQSYPEFNDYSYKDCLKDLNKGKRNSCDCWDYLTTKRKCFRDGFDGSCSGDLETRAGLAYQIQVRKFGDSAEISAYENNSRRTVGSGRCDMYGRHTITEEETVGTGRSNAHQAGIYYCPY